jgi:CRP/FNR family cyclic AMP-dependent transcriptional regulator
VVAAGLPPAPTSRTFAQPMKINLFNTDPLAERFPAGHTVFNEGEVGEHMFAVVKGSVEITINGKFIDLVESGSVFGEMALVEDKPRIATAIVKADAELVRIDRKRFLFLVQQTPFFSLQLMGIMAERLRRMNEKL